MALLRSLWSLIRRTVGSYFKALATLPKLQRIEGKSR